jgi:choline dehydrogenase-like flavoprotein
VGLAHLPLNIDPKNVTRSTSRTAYYDPVSSRKNLQLLVKHYATTLAFDGTKATGVNIVSRDSGDKALVKVRKEVIVAAGAIGTPKFLQLSGIGPAKLLEDLRIKVVSDLPGVGSNFQDHPSLFVSYSGERHNQHVSHICIPPRLHC